MWIVTGFVVVLWMTVAAIVLLGRATPTAEIEGALTVVEEPVVQPLRVVRLDERRGSRAA